MSSIEERLRILEERLAQLEAENAALRKENEALRKERDEWRRGFRERGKRRSSKPEKKARARSKRPGREVGHEAAHKPVPDRIDDTEHHEPPSVCTCGGLVVGTGESSSVVVQDLPKIEVRNVLHVAHEGECSSCKKKVRVRLPGQPAHGASIAATVLGPNLLAFSLDLRFKRHVPWRGIAGVVGTWFGLEVTPSALYQTSQRWKARTRPSYDEIVGFTRSSGLVGADETPIRQDGVMGWAWLVRTEKSSLYRIELSRAGWVFDAMVGADFKGTVVSDFYAVYTTRNGFTHAYCATHVIRTAKQIAEVAPTEHTEAFRDRLLSIYERAKESQASGSPSAQQGAKIALGMLASNAIYSENKDIARLQARIKKHFAGIVAFVTRPEVPADNSAAERDIRDLASFRKVSGGTRSAEGSAVVAHWKSVGQTLQKNVKPWPSWFRDAYAAYWQGRPPPSVFAEA